ncbi:MAG: HAD-IIB family hydrolase [Microgenomates group bacterium]
MIKGIILDVDGVIVGEKIGYNSPYPHTDVIHKLKEIKQKGIPVSLCTAKPSYSIKKIIDDAGLNNLHITDGGGVVIDPIDNIILKKYFIDKQLCRKVIQHYIANGAYTEFYTLTDYFIQKDQKNELTNTHEHILQRAPQIVQSLIEETEKQNMIKIMPIAKDEEEKKRLTELFIPFQSDLTLSWGIHPIALPHQFGIITAKGISKKQAALEIADSVGIKPEEMLGIGDSTSDWQFIEPCGFAGAMGNASEELKNLVKSKGDTRSFIGKSVDENGILDIFDFFKIASQ